MNGHTQEALDATDRTWAEIAEREAVLFAADVAALEWAQTTDEPDAIERVVDDGSGVMWLHRPDPDCPHCHGSGEVECVDWVPMPFGPGNCAMTTIEDCDCGEWLELGPATED